MASKWFYSQDGVRRGPVSSAELRQLAREGVLKPQDLLWKEGMAEWLPASKTQGLFPDVGPGTAASPPPLPSQENEAAQPSLTARAKQIAEGLIASVDHAYAAQTKRVAPMNTQLSGPYRREAPASPTDDEQTQQQNSLSDRGRRSRYAGLGCLTVMLVFLVSGLLLPGGRNKSKQQSELVSGVLASFDEEPPLITEAIKAKKEVVLLENTHSDVISGVDAIYFVLDGSDIDFIVEKFRVFRGSEHYWSAYPKGAVRNGDEGVEWTVTRMPSGMMARRNELSIVQKPNIVIVTKSSMAIEATWDPVGSGCSWTAECRMQQITDSKGQRFPKEKQGSIGGIGSRLSP